jgi:hypothetical protein
MTMKQRWIAMYRNYRLYRSYGLVMCDMGDLARLCRQSDLGEQWDHYRR